MPSKIEVFGILFFIEEGYYYLNKATETDVLTRFHLEAIIASLHCSAPKFEDTDWQKIVYLYQQLTKLEPSSKMVTLNQIIAESHLSTENSIKELEALDIDLDSKTSFLIKVAKADVFKRRNELKQVEKAYLEALDLSLSPVDKKFLESKIAQIRITKN